MTRLNQGEKPEGAPPWALVDGRNDRARAIDSEVRIWQLKHPIPEAKRPSELKRGDGLQLNCKFGIAVCVSRQGVRRSSSRFVPRSNSKICGYMNIVKRGVKLPTCRGCGKRIWVKYEDVIFQHDELRVIKRIIAGIRGCLGSGWGFVPTQKFGEWERRALDPLYLAHRIGKTHAQCGDGGFGLSPERDEGTTKTAVGQAPERVPKESGREFSGKKASNGVCASPLQDTRGGACGEVSDAKDSGPCASPSHGRTRITMQQPAGPVTK